MQSPASLIPLLLGFHKTLWWWTLWRPFWLHIDYIHLIFLIQTHTDSFKESNKFMSHICPFQQPDHFCLAWCRGQSSQLPAGLSAFPHLAGLAQQLAEPSKPLNIHTRYTTNSGLMLGLVLVRNVINVPLDIHSSKQVRSLVLRRCGCPLWAIRLPDHWLNGPIPRSLWSAPEQPCQSRNKFCLAQDQLNV